MIKGSRLLLLAGLAWIFYSGHPLRAGLSEVEILQGAHDVLGDVAMRHCNKVPLALLRNAQGVAIFPCVLKVAAGLGGRRGRGVLLLREADDKWGQPIFLTLSGISAGVQVGAEGTHLVLVFRTRRSLEWMQKGRVMLCAGTVLTLGMWGHENSLGTDVDLNTTFLSSSHSGGLCAGVYAEGAFLHLNAAATNAYFQYEKDCSRNGSLISPEGPPSVRLQKKLMELSAPPPVPQAVAPPQCAPPSSPQP